MEKPRNRAKRLLVHYFQQIFEKTHLYWDRDNINEIEDIVDEIIWATLEEIKGECLQED